MFSLPKSFFSRPGSVRFSDLVKLMRHQRRRLTSKCPPRSTECIRKRKISATVAIVLQTPFIGNEFLRLFVRCDAEKTLLFGDWVGAWQHLPPPLLRFDQCEIEGDACVGRFSPFEAQVVQSVTEACDKLSMIAAFNQREKINDIFGERVFRLFPKESIEYIN